MRTIRIKPFFDFSGAPCQLPANKVAGVPPVRLLWSSMSVDTPPLSLPRLPISGYRRPWANGQRGLLAHEPHDQNARAVVRGTTRQRWSKSHLRRYVFQLAGRVTFSLNLI